jgi:hypothetical protein
VAELQRGLDEDSADIYNAGFAADVVWGGPFGATVTGYDALHGISRRLMTQATAGSSRYAGAPHTARPRRRVRRDGHVRPCPARRAVGG